MLLLSFLLLAVSATISARFKVYFEWNSIDYAWPTESSKLIALNTTSYIPQNILIAGVKYHSNYLYLTLPRMRRGVPATLARIPYKPAENQTDDTSPLLEVYPSWKMNHMGDCKALQNVQNVEIDPENVMWILDGGSVQTLEGLVSNCPPKLVVHDLSSNTTVTSFVFPREVVGNGGFLYDLVLDKTNGGFIYITDNSLADPGIIVYSRSKNKSWKVRDGTMRADPDSVEFIVNGTRVNSPVDIASIAFNPHTNLVYFAPLSSRQFYAINATHLQDEFLTDIADRVMEVGRKSSQTDGMVMDDNGVLYYGLLSANSIAKWNTTLPFATDQKVIARDPTFIQWPDSFAFDDAGNLLVVTNRLQKIIYDKYDVRESNFRILRAPVGARSYLYGQETNQDIVSTSTKIPDASTAQFLKIFPYIFVNAFVVVIVFNLWLI